MLIDMKVFTGDTLQIFKTNLVQFEHNFHLKTLTRKYDFKRNGG